MALENELPLVSTIAAGFSLAFLCGLAASKLRISPIVGYLLAGILVGPHTPGYVANVDLAQQLSEIGIVLLMFGVGLHFSIKDLMEVKKIAITGAVVRIVIITALGAGIASLWGWPLESGLLLGLALSVASTVVLLRALEEQNLQNSMEGRIAIGWLIVEDMITILALVLIPALAGAGHEENHGGIGMALLTAIGKAALFIGLMELAGRKLLPRLLTAVAQTGSRELFTLAVFAAAIGVAFGASMAFDVSLALGAFFAGMIINESDMNHEVAERALPFQDAFAVLFFVAVGMLFNPHILIDEPLRVLAVTGVIIVAKYVCTYLIVALFKYPLKKQMMIGAGLAQIGEFSFILAGLGMIYGILPEEGRDLILAGAILSIALNPLVFLISRRILERKGVTLAEQFNPVEDDLAHLQREEKQVLKDLVVLVGYGRLGKHIFANVQAAHIDMVVIDMNRERVEDLREQGFHAIAGDAGHPETLEEAAISKAVAIAVAVPDPYEARRIVDAARALKPSLKILVRAMNDEELDYFEQQQVDLALMGVREIGRRMVEYLNEMKPKQA